MRMFDLSTKLITKGKLVTVKKLTADIFRGLALNHHSALKRG